MGTQLTAATILCCMCGLPIQQNPTNMCVQCLHENVDITSEINKKNNIHSCRSCNRFLGPPWQQVELESKELMIICLRKIAGLQGVKVVDAVWVWTEPHSMRLKIKLTVQKEIMNGAVIQQATVVEFVIRNQQCKHCEASYATGAWKAIVQVRQRVSHKRTFYYLEQLILKHEAHADCIKIVTFRDGMDFYFKDRQQGIKFISFLGDVVPIKTKYSRKLISADTTNNTADFKHSHLVEIAPICKDDLIILPRELASKQSNISPLVLVKKVSNSISLIDPLSAERTDINAEKYWRNNFNSLMSSRQMIRFVVLSVEAVLVEQKPSARMKRLVLKSNKGRGKSEEHVGKSRAVAALAECVIARERDFGVNDVQFTCLTHLGGLLQAGDTVLGYDLTNSNFNIDEEDESSLSKLSIPDVVLVRKCYERKGERAWKLKKLETEKGEEKDSKYSREEYDADVEDFMQQVEADREFRQQINIYRRKDHTGNQVSFARTKAAASNETMDENEDNEDEYDLEEIRLEELLEEMSLNSELDETEEDKKERNARHMEGFRILSEEEAAAATTVFDLSGAISATDEDDAI
jgi:nonsense-mediated mRNA decay protein 3